MTQTERDTRIEEIRERCEKATKGPWRVDYDKRSYGCHQIVYTNGDGHTMTICFMATPAELTEDDARFMASGRADIPFLLAEIDRLKQALELK